MHIHISTESGVAIYRQIVDQMKYLVASGRLQSGDEVPPIRVLAQQLIINPNTVARAYRELESEGILNKRQGAGTYVSPNGTRLNRKERLRIIRERADGLLAEARQLGIDTEELVEMLRQREEEWREHGEKKNG